MIPFVLCTNYRPSSVSFHLLLKRNLTISFKQSTSSYSDVSESTFRQYFIKFRQSVTPETLFMTPFIAPSLTSCSPDSSKQYTEQFTKALWFCVQRFMLRRSNADGCLQSERLTFHIARACLIFSDSILIRTTVV